MPTKEENEKEIQQASLAFMAVLSKENMEALKKIGKDVEQKFGIMTTDGKTPKDTIDKVTTYMYQHIPSSFNEDERTTFINLLNIQRKQNGLGPFPPKQKGGDLGFLIGMIIFGVIFLAFIVFLFINNYRKKVPPMTAFGKKLAKILKV